MATKSRRKKAKAATKWVEGSVREFLQLFDADMEQIEMRVTAAKRPFIGG